MQASFGSRPQKSRPGPHQALPYPKASRIDFRKDEQDPIGLLNLLTHPIDPALVGILMVSLHPSVPEAWQRAVRNIPDRIALVISQPIAVHAVPRRY